MIKTCYFIIDIVSFNSHNVIFNTNKTIREYVFLNTIFKLYDAKNNKDCVIVTYTGLNICQMSNGRHK